MKITTVGRKVTLKPAFIALAQEKIAKLDKFFSSEAQANITVTVEKKWHTVEIYIKDDSLRVRSEKTAQQMEAALDNAVDTLETQIIKNKRKLGTKIKPVKDLYFDETLPPEDDYEVVRNKVFFMQPQTVDEAILDMNMLGHTFFMFHNKVTDEINVVYKRKDGKYGLLCQE